MVRGLLKSIAVPATGNLAPVGMSVSSTGR